MKKIYQVKVYTGKKKLKNYSKSFIDKAKKNAHVARMKRENYKVLERTVSYGDWG